MASERSETNLHGQEGVQKGNGDDKYFQAHQTETNAEVMLSQRNQGQGQSIDLEESKQQKYSKMELETNTTPSSTKKADLEKANALSRLLNYLDQTDKYVSGKFQEISSLPLELLLIGFAFLFNRTLGLLSIAFFGLPIGFWRYEVMLNRMGFMLPGDGYSEDISNYQRFRYAGVFALWYGLSLGAMVISTQILKYSIRRQRPKSLTHVQRITRHLRTSEEGTFAMPSGDSSAAANFCFMFAVMAGIPVVYIMLPLVCMGRVFYHCHWFGDTIAGSVVGTLWGLAFVLAFPHFAFLHRMVAGGPETFVEIPPMH